MMIVTIYTDGSASPVGTKPNMTFIGSYGVVLTAKINGVNYIKKFSSEKYLQTTNNRMELKAIIKALQMVDVGHKIDIYTDSEYCQKSAMLWLDGWVRSNKLNKKQNSDLWKMYLQERKRHLDNGSSIRITWVRGHNGNQHNELADELANVGRQSKYEGIICVSDN